MSEHYRFRTLDDLRLFSRASLVVTVYHGSREPHGSAVVRRQGVSPRLGEIEKRHLGFAFRFRTEYSIFF